jgi:phosphoribosyl 1,2-cyclic phosphodiesterase
VRIKILGSGSAGNAMVVEGGRTRLLVDAGLGPRILVERLREAGIEPESLSAVLLTHEHADHIRSAISFSRRWGVPLRGSQGTGEALGVALAESAGFEPLPRGRSCRIGDVDVCGVPVPHDAAEPLAFVLESGGGVLGIATDLGHMTDDLVDGLKACTTIVMESNYDPGLLRAGPYPWNLKERIASPRGHLANVDVARFVARSLGRGCRSLILAHLSETNNHPDVARMTIEPALRAVGGDKVRLVIAERSGSDWVEAGPVRQGSTEGPTQLPLFP